MLGDMNYKFSTDAREAFIRYIGPRPFFQIEAVETIRWLTEVAPKRSATKVKSACSCGRQSSSCAHGLQLTGWQALPRW